MSTDTVIYFGFLVLSGLFAYRQFLLRTRPELLTLDARDAGPIAVPDPPAQHPYIDLNTCIGCSSCVNACPESALGMVAGNSALINPQLCIGHGLCAVQCCVHAITIVGPTARVASQLPVVSEDYETNVPNLYVVGELGGIGLIANAVNQGVDCVDLITDLILDEAPPAAPDVVDVCVVGAGPAGVAAALRAIQNELACVLLERDRFGGTVEKYPRQKVVTTVPVVLPLVGWFKKTEVSKEDILGLWRRIADRARFHVNENEEVTSIDANDGGVFTIETAKHGNAHARYRARRVILATGRRGTPQRLGVPGEELGKVMYSLLEAHKYRLENILVVGGGQGAVETALALSGARAKNAVTLSYRGSAFKPARNEAAQRNLDRLDARVKAGRVRVIFDSVPVRFTPDSAVLSVKGDRLSLTNSYVWICVGGETPAEFLTKIGVALGPPASETSPPPNRVLVDPPHIPVPSLEFLVTVAAEFVVWGVIMSFAP